MILDEGFDEAFPLFCARTLSSFSYPPGNLLAARMHAYYLREALDFLTTTAVEQSNGIIRLGEEIAAANAYAERMGLSMGEPMEASLAIGWACYQAVLERGEDFCRLFISNWCRFYSDGESL